ncbi:hypothetical protein F383_23351 [Gossypium arboreum]|uniref:Uncharacterized protein n=1 Tax=Gossypium arboreum TaxID=29729 RepID=A0A0B0NZG7_GOSAR|nr:hypothetical protein F383_23351 [Gossypium arboreum]
MIFSNQNRGFRNRSDCVSHNLKYLIIVNSSAYTVSFIRN